MLKILASIKPSELEQSVMLLSGEYVNKMIPVIGEVLERFPFATELVLRCLYYLMKFHLAQVRLSDKQVLKRVADLAYKRQGTCGFDWLQPGWSWIS